MQLLTHTVSVDTQYPVGMLSGNELPSRDQAVESFLRNISPYCYYLFMAIVRYLVGKKRKRVMDHFNIIQFRPFLCILVAQYDETFQLAKLPV